MQKEDLDGTITAVPDTSFILVQKAEGGYWRVYHAHTMGENDESLIIEVHSELSDSFVSRSDALAAIENHLRQVEEMQEEDARRMTS